jgi:molybdenum cofactor cytidylyltransferase
MPEPHTVGDDAHAVVVLAAGGSRRLGVPKQLLTRDGEPLLRRCVRLAAETAPARLLVVLGAQAERMHAALEGLDCRPVHNSDWTRGMQASVRAAASGVDAFGRVLVLGCDQPALERAHLQHLLDGAAAAASGCAATLAEDAAPGIPAVVPGHWFTHLEDAGQDRGFGPRLRALPRASLHLLHAPALWLDLDTPAQLEIARHRGLVDA